MQTEQDRNNSAVDAGEERGVQLRLFPPPKPLLERFGAAFFRRVPARPGVYLMSGDGDHLLYVGQSQNLRSRLSSYKSLPPERASRKLIRLVHEVRAITWEIVSCPEEARLRENELLRLHRPKFNVTNTRPEHYAFVGVQRLGEALCLRLTKSPEAEPGERLFGAFKAIGGVRAAFAALLRLVWTAGRQSLSPHEIPSTLVHGKPPERFAIPLVPLRLDELVETLNQFLSGEESQVVDLLAAALPARDGVCPFLAKLWEQDVERLRDFYRFGPFRNRDLRRTLDVADDLIGLTLNTQSKVLDALNRATGKNYSLGDLFNY